MKPNRQDIRANRQAGVNSDRWKRLGWWLAAALPTFGALLLLQLENMRPPQLSERWDVSSICLLSLGAFVAVVGIARVTTAIAQGRGALNAAQHRLADGTRHAVLLEAYETRLRSGWLILLGTGLAVLGGWLAWLAVAEM